MKLRQWHIDLMAGMFGVALTPDDHQRMVSELLERLPYSVCDVIIHKKRIEFRYDADRAKVFFGKMRIERDLAQAH